VEFPKISGRTKQRVIRPISTEGIFLLEKHLEGEKLKLMLLISYFCGLRLGGLLKLNIMSFNWDKWKTNTEEAGEVIVHEKGDKEGIAYVPSFLMRRIARFIRSTHFNAIDNRLFINSEEDIKLKDRGRIWQMRLREAGIRSGISKLKENGEVIDGTGVHPHRLRHSYATHLLEKGLNLSEIKEALRHSSIQSTQIYTHINRAELKEKLNLQN